MIDSRHEAVRKLRSGSLRMNYSKTRPDFLGPLKLFANPFENNAQTRNRNCFASFRKNWANLPREAGRRETVSPDMAEAVSKNGRTQELVHDALWLAMRSGQRDEFAALLSRGVHNINRRDDDDVYTTLQTKLSWNT